MHVLVLTGATVPFNELVELFSAAVVDRLRTLGYDRIVIQYGLATEAFENGPGRLEGVEGFAFKSDLSGDLEKADLIVSHAGTGSILDALRRNKPLVVVSNSSLMHNHQLEVAQELDGKQLLLAAPADFTETLLKASTFDFAPLPAPVSLQNIITDIVH